MSAAPGGPCARVAAHLSAYVDGELGARERRAVALHLARCEGCRAERDAILALGEFARGLPIAAPPAGLAARVRAGERPRPTGAARRAAAAAALALLAAGALAGAYLLGRGHGAEERGNAASAPLSPVDPSDPGGPPDARPGWPGRDRGESGLTGGPLLSPR